MSHTWLRDPWPLPSEASLADASCGYPVLKGCWTAEGHAITRLQEELRSGMPVWAQWIWGYIPRSEIGNIFPTPRPNGVSRNGKEWPEYQNPLVEQYWTQSRYGSIRRWNLRIYEHYSFFFIYHKNTCDHWHETFFTLKYFVFKSAVVIVHFKYCLLMSLQNRDNGEIKYSTYTCTFQSMSIWCLSAHGNIHFVFSFECGFYIWQRGKREDREVSRLMYAQIIRHNRKNIIHYNH